MQVHRNRLLRTTRRAIAAIAHAKRQLATGAFHRAISLATRDRGPTRILDLPVRSIAPAIAVCVEVIKHMRLARRNRNRLRHTVVVIERPERRASIQIPCDLACPVHGHHRHINRRRSRHSVCISTVRRQREGGLAARTLNQASNVTACKLVAPRIKQLPVPAVPPIPVGIIVADSVSTSRQAQVLV